MTATPTPYETQRERLRREPRTWLVTGAAGFIGSNLVEHLRLLDRQAARPRHELVPRPPTRARRASGES